MKQVLFAFFIFLFCGQGLSDDKVVLSSARELTHVITADPSNWKSYEGTYFDVTCSVTAITHGLIISDPTGHSQANIQPSIPPPSPGDCVNIRGIIEFCKSGRIMPLCTAIKILNHGQPPNPIPVYGSDFMGGRCDFKLIRATGTILDIVPDAVDENYDILILACDSERIPCPVKRGSASEFLGHEVEAIGTCVPAPPMSRQMIGRILVITSPLRRLDNDPNDFFDVPELTKNRFRQPKDLSTLGRHKVHGKVLAVWNRGALIETDENLVTRLEFRDSARPFCGDTIEAAGLPETDLYSPILRRAMWRTISSAANKTPVPVIDVPFSSIYIDSCLATNETNHRSSLLHGKAIRTAAKVRSMPSVNGLIDYMLIGSDKLSIPIDISSVFPRPKGLTVGSTVEITGIYLLECQPWRANVPVPPIEDVRIIVRSAEDIRILSTPPWWTAGRLLVVVGILGATLLFVIIWNIALRRMADRRGRKLSTERIARAEAEIKTMERTRLAVELHDTIAQNLVGVSIALDTARQFSQAARPELMQQIEVADATLDACQVELRNCLWDLRNQALDESDLNTAIRMSLQPHINDTPLDIRFNINRSRLTENTTHTILRIIRELVINAIRHGRSTHIQIAGAIDPDALRFSVRDNGCGFDTNNCPGINQRHFGLQGIRERLSLLGGEMKIESSSDNGTRVVCSIPLANHQDQAMPK